MSILKLGHADERLFGELQESIRSLSALLSPVTERFAPVDDLVKRVLTKQLCTYDTQVTVGIIGPKGSGKSSLVNAMIGADCIPENTEVPLIVLPSSKEEEFCLRTATGKAIALGAEGVKSHLESEAKVKVAELSDRRLHCKLLEGGKYFSVPWRLVDFPATTTGILPKLSSVASRTFAPNEFAADVIVYCVDIRHLGDSEKECEVFDSLFKRHPEELQELPSDADDEEGEIVISDNQIIARDQCTPMATRRRLKEQTVFVLTFADFVSDHEECLTNVHSNFVPKLPTIQACVDRFNDLCVDVFGEAIDQRNILVVSNRNAVLTKTVLRTSSTAFDIKLPAPVRDAAQIQRERDNGGRPEELPNVPQLYEYSERMFGSAFMQQIDNNTEDELRKLVVHHAKTQGVKSSGAASVDNYLALLDFNVSRDLMSAATVAAAEVVDTLHVAILHGAETIRHEHESATQTRDLLTNELQWVRDSISKVQSAAQEVVHSVESLVDDALSAFFLERLDELQRILEHKPLEWYLSRQIATVVEAQTALKKYETFAVEYLQQRRYLDEKISAYQQAEALSAAKKRNLNATNTSTGVLSSVAVANEEDGGDYSSLQHNLSPLGGGLTAEAPSENFRFLVSNLDDILHAMEEEKRKQLTVFCTCFAHHLRDEAVLFLQRLEERLSSARDAAVKSFLSTCRTPVEQSSVRSGRVLLVDEVVAPLLSVQLLEANHRRLHNYLRELPEHVATAAVELSNDQYQRHRSASLQMGEADNLDSEDDDDDDNTRNSNKSTTNASNWERHIKLQGLPKPGKASMSKHLSYVMDAWKLALNTTTTEHITTCNVEELTSEVAKSSASVVGFLSELGQSVADGLDEQLSVIDGLEKDMKDLEAASQKLEPFEGVFQSYLEQLREINCTDEDSVKHQRLVERTKREAAERLKRRGSSQPSPNFHQSGASSTGGYPIHVTARRKSMVSPLQRRRAASFMGVGDALAPGGNQAAF